MARAAPPTVTEADLRSAWCDMRRPGWPATYEEAMQDPWRSRLVRLEATHRVRSAAAHKAYPLRSNGTTERERIKAYITQHLGTGHPYGAIKDVKRAAAGDRDDD